MRWFVFSFPSPLSYLHLSIPPSSLPKSTADALSFASLASSFFLLLVHPARQYFRPCEVDLLLGDPSKAEKTLGWKRACDFDTLVREMVESDMRGVANPIEDQVCLHPLNTSAVRSFYLD
jgi:hypothetical protein